MKKQFATWLSITSLVLVFSGCSKGPDAAAKAPPVPSSWVIGSENETEDFTEKSALDGADDESADAEVPALSDATRDLFSTQASSLDGLPAPKKAPWRMSAVITELSISASGWLGFLVQKGTPSVLTIWRRQYPAAPAPAVAPVAFADTEAPADVTIDPEKSKADIERDLEPSVQALLSTGTIKDENSLRRNLLSAAADFQNVVTELSAVNQRGQWWVSRFRLDFSIDASGNVTPAVTIGAEARLRFEWFRLKPKAATPTPPKPAFAAFGKPGLGTNLVSFAENLADDLSEIADDAKTSARGFRAYGYRVGLGISAKGNVGVAKAMGTLTGHLYFARDVKKPVVNPKPIEGATMNLITSADAPAKIDRKAFRKGLRKALRIGRFFSRHADKTRGKWKIHELRTGFELSLGGKTGIVTVGGVAATEISFYNQNF